MLSKLKIVQYIMDDLVYLAITTDIKMIMGNTNLSIYRIPLRPNTDVLNENTEKKKVNETGIYDTRLKANLKPCLSKF